MHSPGRISPAMVQKCKPGSPIKNSIIDKSLKMHMQARRSKDSLFWGSISAVLLAIILFDLSNKCPYSFSKWYYVKYAAAAVLSCSILFYVTRYFYYKFFMDPIYGTEEQRRLLQFDKADSSFITPKASAKPSSQTPMNISSSYGPWNSFNDSGSVSISSPGWVFSKGSPQKTFGNQSIGSLNVTRNSSFNASNASPNVSTSFSSPYKQYLNKKDILSSEKDLQQYLKESSIQEENMNAIQEAHNAISGPPFNTFWNNFRSDEASNLLKTSVYQLSSTISPNKQPGKEDVTLFSPNELDGTSEIVMRLSSAKLTQYVTSLRMWISLTVLQRLVLEINAIDAAFQARGLADMKIGQIGLERLKKTTENLQLVAMHMPKLPTVVQFLDLSSNQEYLVERIRDLAKGSCIADYKWSSGSSFNGLSWDEHLPTDSGIVFHLFCTYMDSQLMPLPQPGGRPFFNRYVIMGDKKSLKETLAEVRNKAKCAILCTNPTKPKFNFISDNKIHNCVHDRNNLFYVIIQFLIYMKNHESSLDGVSLGKNGINILCTIEE